MSGSALHPGTAVSSRFEDGDEFFLDTLFERMLRMVIRNSGGVASMGFEFPADGADMQYYVGKAILLLGSALPQD